MTLQSWVEFVRHEDRREDHTMFGVLRLRTDGPAIPTSIQTVGRSGHIVLHLGNNKCLSGKLVSQSVSQQRRQADGTDSRQSRRRTNGLEMKCFNQEGLMWIGAARNGILIIGVEPIESTI